MKFMKVFLYEEIFIREFAKEYSLCVIGKSLNVVFMVFGIFWDNLD